MSTLAELIDIALGLMDECAEQERVYNNAEAVWEKSGRCYDRRTKEYKTFLVEQGRYHFIRAKYSQAVMAVGKKAIANTLDFRARIEKRKQERG